MNLDMHQRGYAEKLLEKFGMKDANPVKTLLTPGIKLSIQDSPDEVDPELQRTYIFNILKNLVTDLLFCWMYKKCF